MAIRAYFDRPTFPLTAATTLRGGLAGNGITVHGPVLEGRMSVDEALVLSWIRSAGAARQVTAQAGLSPERTSTPIPAGSEPRRS